MIYVRMYAWLCIAIAMHTMHGYICMAMHVCMYVCLYVWLCMYGYVCVAMYVWLCMYGYACMAMYVWLCMYVYRTKVSVKKKGRKLLVLRKTRS